jgi:xylan 1,4-beta-xylosidase
MLGLMGEARLPVASTSAISAREMKTTGVRKELDADAIAAHKDREVEVLILNYHDDDVAVADALVDLTITGLPATEGPMLVEHYRVDANHSNAFTIRRQTGAPQQPTLEQYKKLKASSQLALDALPERVLSNGGVLLWQFTQPREGLSLKRIQ